MINPSETGSKDGEKSEIFPLPKKGKRLPAVTAAMLVFFGNSAGMLAAVLLWKYTGKVIISISLMLLIAAAAFFLTVFFIKKYIADH